ncbi:septal ring lytic transglycosylase RlpA family protein [Arcobacter sp. FWKO B]|uniref:septal ring lytic transglycosylase RlpA family protein n=1 Tax=Arcobacter sp. FWKO B TaxID=2593672 RepID=UPI001D195E49|nr:septal ring lytic transglycosylase RlpA family protein [Arcobacter sp. FWKO B]
MLLKIRNFVLLSSTVFLFSGCFFTKQVRSTGYYSPTPSGSYIQGNEEIKNSPAMHRATMRPYQVFGKWYHPTTAGVGDEQRGIASWYGPKFHGKKTSNGEIYNMHAITAAHKTLPMNTIVRVDNLDNGKSVVVRVNDRGPFVGDRIIDLSYAAAGAIDMQKKGLANVKLTILGFHGKVATTEAEKQEKASVSSYYIQVGAFRNYSGAKITQDKFKMILDGNYNVIIKEGEFEDKPIHRVWLSGFRSIEEANDFKAANNLDGAMIIAE